MSDATPSAETPVDTSAPALEAAPGSVETPLPVVPQLETQLPVPPDPLADTQAPTIQPPLPVPIFGEHGAADTKGAVVPSVKKGVYVDTDGVKHAVEIVAQRKDGSVDILLPAGVGNIRRDGVRRRTTDAQTTDYLE